MLVNELKSLVHRLFHRYDDYLVIEILNHYLQFTFLKVNSEKKIIRVVDNWFRPLAEFNTSSALLETKLLLKKIRKLGRYKTVLSLDSQFASTIFASVSLVRSHPKEVIDEADLDNLISQAVWRFFDKNRIRVAQKMNIDDIDVLLGDVRIRGIKIDGHRVVNPIGFKAKSVEIAFSQTFLSREFLRGLKSMLPKGQPFLITESGTALGHVLSKILNEKSVTLANLFPNQTALFAAAGSKVGHIDNFNWGEANLIHLLHRHFRLDAATARDLIEKYTENGVSETFARRLETILMAEFQTFGNGLESLASEENTVYLNPYFKLPTLVYSDRFRNRLEKSFEIVPLSTQIITEKFGYAVKWNTSASMRNPVSVLGALFETMFLPQEDKLSHLANRRVRWLIS